MYFKFLTDDEMVEAVIGGIGFYFIIGYFREHLKWSRLKSAGCIFPLVWIMRKVGVNLYNYIKMTRKIQLKTIVTKKF